MTATDQRDPAPIEVRAVLRRSHEDRMLFGVCGGVARYLGIDPAVVRITFVLLVIFGGSGVLLYLIGLVAIPSDDGNNATAAPTAVAPNGAVVLGAVLVALGSLLLAGRIIPGFGDLFAPIVLLSVGVVVILAGRR